MLVDSTLEILVVGLLFVTSSLGSCEQPNARTPRERYEALLRDYEAADAAFEKSGAKIGPADPLWVKKHSERPLWIFTPRMLQFAEENRHDPAALEALLRIVESSNRGTWGGDRSLFSSVRRAVDILIADHLQDGRVIQTCVTVSASGGSREAYFRALLAKSRDREVLGRACMALAYCNEVRLYVAARPWFDHPEDFPDRVPATTYLIARLDPDYIAYFRTADPVALLAEREALWERVINEFGDIPLLPKWSKAKPDGRTLADYARPKLEAIRSLAVGKVAPDIHGEDVDRKPMRLSDHRGKIVVLVFWGTWCGPCMGFVPREKALVKRLKDRPFVLLGINSDSDRDKLKTRMEKEGITWRSWWDGGKTGGPIATRWDVHAWPTIIVLDEKGVIRFNRLPHFTPIPLDDAVDTLLKEMMR